MSFVIRKATPKDNGVVVELLREFAIYEKMEDMLQTDDALLNEWVHEKECATICLGEEDGVVVGYIIYFKNYSSFTGKSGLYLEDLYVRPQYRGKGYGKVFFKYLAKEAVDNGYARMEWVCLNWNKPSIDFYLKNNAEQMTDWTNYRLSGDTLLQAAK